MPKKKRKNEDTELIAVITAAIAAALEEGEPMPVITAVREAEIPKPAMAAVRDTEIPEAVREEEKKDPADSFAARTIKRREPAKRRKEFGL